MQEFVVVVDVLSIAIISASVGYVLYSFWRERKRTQDHLIMMNHLREELPMLLQGLQEQSSAWKKCEKVNWKEEGF